MSPLPGLEDFSSCAFTHGWRRVLNDHARFTGFQERPRTYKTGPRYGSRNEGK